MESKLWGWQILFLIEGAFTFAFAVLVAMILPWSLSSATFLTEREKEVGRLRVLKDGSEKTETKFQPRTFFKPLSDWKFYVFGAIGTFHIRLKYFPQFRTGDVDSVNSNVLRHHGIRRFELSHSNHWTLSFFCSQNQPVHRGALRLRDHRPSDHCLLI